MSAKHIERNGHRIVIPSGWRELNEEVEFIEKGDRFFSPGAAIFMDIEDADIGGMAMDYCCVIRKENK